jgi:hypothetical protein
MFKYYDIARIKVSSCGLRLSALLRRPMMPSPDEIKTRLASRLPAELVLPQLS